MKIIEKIKRALLLPLVGLLFATSLIAPTTPVYADPVPETVETTETTEETETPAETTEETEETEETETTETSTEVETTEGATCMTQVGTIGWIVCPTAAFLAKAVDNIYKLVEDLLVVQPISTDENSPVFLIWMYVRNITNIVFIILFLVIIYSQLTGFGISNYGIKKALPKLIIAAILVNLSYIICAFAVDLSNIIGAGIKSFIEGIMTEAINNGTFSSQDVSVTLYQVFTAIAAGGVIGSLAIGFSGGPLGLLLALIPVILGGIISVAIGFLTISLRHAIIILLIVVSPLAMIAYILPNTEKWHKKWVETFTQMIVFFPLFALLFGASKLASWLLISASTSMTGVILGLAIQVLPLFLAVKLMKMSGTVLGAISGALDNLGNKATGATAAAIEPYKEYAKKQQLAANLRKPFNPLSGGSWRAVSAKSAAKIDYKNAQADKLVKGIQAEHLNASRMNKRIIGFDENNKPYYSHVYRRSSSVNNIESAAGEAALREQISTTQADMYNSSLDSYYTANNVKRGRATKTAKHMGQHYFDYRNALLAKARSDEADERWYIDQVNNVIARDKVTTTRGESIHNLSGDEEAHRRYLQFVKDTSGSDGFTINGVNEHEFTVAPGTIGGKTEAERFADAQRAVINVMGDVASYDKALREGTRKRYEAFLDTQETSIVADYYKSIINNKDFEGFLATNHIFSRRGDYDKVAKGIDEFLKGEEFDLGDYRTSALALDLLAMKDAAPALGRLGKFINMETWRYSQGDRRTAKVDIEQYVTGIVKDERDALGNSYRTKIDLAAALEGTSFMKMDRTGLDAQRVFMDSAIASANLDYNSEVQLREKVGAAMLPALLTASLSMDSGSEAHRAVMRELTGMKLNPDTGKWKDATRSDAERRAVEVLFNEYLNGHTASNVAGLKTEGWGAIVARSKEIIKATPGGEALSDEALAEEVNRNMQNIWADQIAILKKSSGYHVANMKPGIAKALGIEQGANSQVNSLNTTTHTDNDDAENRGGGDGGNSTGNGRGNSDGNGNGGNGGNGHGRGGNGGNGGDSNSINYAGLTGAGGGQGGGSGSSNDPKPFQLGSPSSPDSGATRQDISDLKDSIDNLTAILKDRRDEYHEEYLKNKDKGRL